MITQNSLYKIWNLSSKKYLFYLQCIINIILTFISIFVSNLAQKTIDNHIIVSAFGKVAIKFAFISISGILLSYLLQYVKTLYTVQLTYNLKMNGMDRIAICRYEYIENEHSGIMINKMTHDMNNVSDYLSGSFSEFIGDMITFLFSFIYLLTVNTSMTLTCALCIPVTLWIAKRIATPTYNTMSSFWSQMDHIAAMTKDTITGSKIEKSYNLNSIRRSEFNRNMDQATASYVEYERLVAKVSPFKYLINSAPTLICIMVGFYNAYRGQITNGEFVSFVLLLKNIANPLSNFIGYITDFKEAQVSMDRVLNIINLDNEQFGHYASMPVGNNCFELNHVSFSYSDEPVLTDFTYHFPIGSTIAIVGASGSGKSTLFKLLTGLYKVSSGHLLLFSHDINDWDIEEARKQIAYVSQNSYLFNGTIAENISAGCANATFDEIVVAAKMAYAHEFIMSFEQGYQTILTEGGNNLSGGQKQRIAIARAFIKNAPILLLDEMTSALDTDSERFIQMAIDGQHKNKTVIIIAHRLSTIQNADEILVLDKGKVAEHGTHQSLLNKNGVYRQLYGNDEAHI